MNDEQMIWEAYENKKPKKLTNAFIAKQARSFFAQKEDPASQSIANCKNTSEIEYRLGWLENGSLKYHLIGGQYRNTPHGGDPVELGLYKEFQQHLDQFR